MIEDINGFLRLVKVTGRTFEQLQERMITQVRVPASIVQFGESPGGAPWVVLKISAVEKQSAPKKAKELPIPSPNSEGIETI